MSRKYKFAVGERILCYHGPLIYEAKCLKAVETGDKTLIYLIHYVGWNKKWDEWILEENLLKYNNQNLRKQAKVNMAYKAQPAIRKIRSKKATNLEHSTSKQDDQNVENNEPSTSKDQASCSDVSNKLCDRPDPAVESEKQMVKGEVQESTSKKGVSEEEQQKSPNSSSTDVTNKEFEEMHAYVDRSPEKYVSEWEGNTSASSSSTDVPDKECDELHAYVNRTPEEHFSEGEGDTAPRNSRCITNAPVKELNEPLPFVDCANQIVQQVEIRIEIPEELRHCLADDWELVSQQKKLVILPEKHNITDILNAYLDYKSDTCPSINWRADAVREVFLGLRNYFTTVLKTELLYNIERSQYSDIENKYGNGSVHLIYGSIHLLRLFDRIGPLLSYKPSMPEENTVRLITCHFEELLQYLVLKKSEYFGTEHYENASEEYLRRVR